MSVDATVSALSTLAVSLFSGVFPVISLDLYLFGASAFLPRALVPALIAAAVIGQVISRSVLYFAGRGVLQLPLERVQHALDSVGHRLRARRFVAAGVILGSAACSLPPFSLVTLAAGASRYPFAWFLGAAAVGLTIRFTIVAFALDTISLLGGIWQ